MLAKSRSRLWFTLFFLLSVLYLARDLKRGWVPMDEATLGLSADYVLQGELPHRDYFEGYTGGLTYLNTVAFRIFGPNSTSLRYMMFLFLLAWVPAVYYVASRFVPAIAAGPLTFLAVAWGVPNYSAAMPSWYNLFFATFGLAALLRYIEVQKLRWLVIAGLCGGTSFLFKQIGLFFIAGVLLFLLFREQVANITPKTSAGDEPSRLYRVFLWFALLIFTLFLFDLIAKRLGVITLCYFFLPAALLAVPILLLEHRGAANRTHRFRFLFRELLTFVAGVSVPVMIFMVPFVRGGAVSDLIREVFIAPSKQIANVGTSPTLLKFFGGVAVNALLALGIFVVRPMLTGPRSRRVITAIALLAMPVGLVLARSIPAVYKAIFATIWVLLPTLVICGSILIIRRFRLRELRDLNENGMQKLFVMLSVVALCSLVQFPAIAGIYFCYTAPLVVLAAAAVVSFLQDQPRWFLVGSYCFVLLYVVFEVTPGLVLDIGTVYSADTQTVPVNLSRTSGIRTFPARARIYQELNSIIRAHARGEYIFATPDCPEMYFLYGFRNPTRYFFDFWDDSPDRTQRILSMIQTDNINLVVLNNDPLASAPVSKELKTAFEQQFPNRASAGSFEVRWKP
ncbi:MAG TPA: glycosyltransferase family 39 protein [Terriglobales bacterium]|nr:glycosyltransferase family 39 protein [Terriglobales bacterium]